MDEKVSGFMCCLEHGIPHKYVNICKNPQGKYYVVIDYYRSDTTFDSLMDTAAVWRCIHEIHSYIVGIEKIKKKYEIEQGGRDPVSSESPLCESTQEDKCQSAQ